MKKNKGVTYKHIAVIRLSAMGDVAMTVPVLHIFRQTYPEVKLTLITRAFFVPFFDGIPNLNIVIADVKGKHKGVLGLNKLANEVKALHIDAVADLHNVLRSNILKRIFKLSGIPVVQIDKGRREKKALVRKKNKVFIPLTSTHQRYADVFKALGFPLDLATPKFQANKPLTDNLKKILGELNNKNTIGIAPFAAFEGKMYPLKLMKQVIAQLDQENKYTIVLFGGGNKEKNLLEPIAETYSNCVSVVGKLSFEEELALISNLKLMIAMDSGNAHMAANFGIPVITIWGVTHPYAGFYPYGQPSSNAILADRDLYPLIPTSIYGNKFPEGYERAMYSINPQNILDKIEEVLLN